MTYAKRLIIVMWEADQYLFKTDKTDSSST